MSADANSGSDGERSRWMRSFPCPRPCCAAWCAAGSPADCWGVFGKRTVPGSSGARTQRDALLFAKHFLSDPGDGADVTDSLPLVLEALALAYVDVSKSESLAPLLPYIELRQLGRSQPEGSLLNYGVLAPAFEGWVSGGQLDPAFNEASALLAQPSANGGTASASEAERLNHLERLCRKSIDLYENMYEEARSNWDRAPAYLSTAPQWTGLWESHMRPALNDIAAAAHKRAQTSVGTLSIPIA